MPNWTSSMAQQFEYYIVDPGTWQEVSKLDSVIKAKISRDATAETLGSATIDVTQPLKECYIRIYLITRQNSIEEKFPLGTFLVETPSITFDGKVPSVSLDAYTPLIELKENLTPLGYYLAKGENIMSVAYNLCFSGMRGPVVKTTNDRTLKQNFIAGNNENWLSFITSLIANAEYKLDLDAMGNTMFAPNVKVDEMSPIWEYNDSNSSILYPEIDIDQDMYGIPNVVEVLYSTPNGYLYSKVVNDEPNSPVSVQNRGREIVYRSLNPNLVGLATQGEVDDYAKELLRTLSTLEYKVSYTHGYCPVRVGDCVLLNYEAAGLSNVKCKVIKQTIECSTGCAVSETAVYVENLWKGV